MKELWKIYSYLDDLNKTISDLCHSDLHEASFQAIKAYYLEKLAKQLSDQTTNETHLLALEAALKFILGDD